MIYLRQSTASQSVLIGPFIDDTDGKTAETGLTIANTDIRLSKNGGNMAAKNSGGGTHDEAGWYTITLDATDTNTVGRLQVSVHVAGALPVWMEFHVLEEAIYDALFAASAAGFDSNGRVDVGKFGGTTVTARDIGASVLLSSGTGAGQISLSSGSVTVGTNGDKTGYSLTATTGLGNQTANITGNLSGSVGSVTGAVGSVTGAVGSVTGNVGGNVTGSVGSVLGGINTAAGTIQTLDALDTAQDSQHATTQAAVADVPTVAEFNARTLAAADYFDPAADAVANVTTVGSVANLTINAGAVLAAGTHNPQSGDAFARLGAPAGVSVSADVAAVKADTGTLVSRITSTLFSGITSLGQWLGAMAGKQAADATAQTEIRATGAGSGTYDATTDSQEALRDRGDSAWITATGFSTFDPATDGVTLADGSHGGTAAVLTLERVVVASATEDQPAVNLIGNGTGPGLRSIGGLSGNGANFVPGMFGHGIYAGGGGTGSGIYAYAAQSGHGFSAVSSLAPGIYARTESGFAGDADFGDFRCLLGSADAITAASLAASAVAEIQSGLSTLTAEQVNAQVLNVVSTDALVAGVTIAESLRRIGAITSGQVSGAGSGTETFLDYAGSANSIAVTVDGSGNRTGVAYN